MEKYIYGLTFIFKISALKGDTKWKGDQREILWVCSVFTYVHYRHLIENGVNLKQASKRVETTSNMYAHFLSEEDVAASSLAYLGAYSDL